MARTDVHSPTNLVTEDYEYAYCYDAHPEEGDRRFAQQILNDLIRDGWRFGQVHGGDTCDHCGARLRYVAVLKHVPTRTLIKVGEQCLDNRFSLATDEFHRLRKSAKLNRERKALRDKRDEWLSDPQNAEAYEYAVAKIEAGEDWVKDYEDESFEGKFVRFVKSFGEASEKFRDAMLRSKVRDAERKAKIAADAVDAKPVIEGKIIITGEVISTKLHENAYGVRDVMTVKDDRGFKVWGTSPSALSIQKGDRITFTATVTKSDRDETFGFFKRPTQASIISTQEESHAAAC